MSLPLTGHRQPHHHLGLELLGALLRRLDPLHPARHDVVAGAEEVGDLDLVVRTREVLVHLIAANRDSACGVTLGPVMRGKRGTPSLRPPRTTWPGPCRRQGQSPTPCPTAAVRAPGRYVNQGRHVNSSAAC